MYGVGFGYGAIGATTKRSGGVSYDSDAQAFFTANSTLTDVTKKNKVNQLFIDLKSYGLFSKFYAFYLLNLGDATKNKFNIVNPIDSDSAFRLVFSSGFTFSDIATTPNGAGAFAKTFLTPSSVFTDESIHLSTFGTQNVESRYEIGCWSPENSLLTRYGSPTTAYLVSNNGTFIGGQNTDNSGFIIGNNLGGTTSILRNNALIATASKSFSKGGTPLAIWCSNRSSDYSANAEYSFLPMSVATIGKGLTSQQMTDLNTCIQAYNL